MTEIKKKPNDRALIAGALIANLVERGFIETDGLKWDHERMAITIKERGGLLIDKETAVDWAFKMLIYRYEFDPRQDEIVKTLLADAYDDLEEKLS